MQGGVTSQAFGQNDAFDIEVVGTNIRVQVNNAIESVPLALVNQIVLAWNGGSDTFDIDPAVEPMVKHVQFVVSTNQDSNNAGTLGDGVVDIDAAVPGAQIPLRAAIMDVHSFVSSSTLRGIYVPRGHYELTVEGFLGETQGDIDITRNLMIIGAGAGETIIDATPLRTAQQGQYFDRLFEVIGGGTLNLFGVTLTGGRVSSVQGGAIRVQDGGTLHLAACVIVGNESIGTGNVGGGIGFERLGGGTIRDSVITGNSTTGSGGGLFLGNIPEVPEPATVIMTGTIVANNTAGAGAPYNDIHANNRTLTSEGFNRVESHGPTFTPNTINDYVGAVDYVVTGVADTYDGTTDNVVMSIRDAIHQANITAGAQEIWLPGWRFTLTRDRATCGGGSVTDTSVAFGDLDIGKGSSPSDLGGSLTVRGVNSATSVAWRVGAPQDKVFELLGDYNNDGVTDQSPGDVDTSDWIVWVKGMSSADGNDDGVVNGADETVWNQNFGTSLMLYGIV